MKRLFIVVLMLSWIGSAAQTTIGFNAAELAFKRISLTFEAAGDQMGIRPLITCPFPGTSDRLGAAIDLRFYTGNRESKIRFYGGISPGVFRTDRYETPYTATGHSVKTIYNGFVCAGINFHTKSILSIGLGGAGGIAAWKTSGTWFGWLSGRPEIIIALTF